MNRNNPKQEEKNPHNTLGSNRTRLKVCGMKSNTQEVADLQPEYLGFIFWEPSSRYCNGAIPKLPSHIKKVGVFVDAPIKDILEKIEKFNLWGVQLHGNESPAYCKELRGNFQNKNKVNIIKAFSIDKEFDFSKLAVYQELCDYFLFDTKGKLPGGNGYTFDWSVLKNYTLTKPYFLSGGIGAEEIDVVKKFIQQPEAKYCHAIDVNSKFEDAPGLKNIKKLKEFKRALRY